MHESIYMKKLVQGFSAFKNNNGSLEQARNSVRTMLHDFKPMDFPMGEEYSYLDTLPMYLFNK